MELVDMGRYPLVQQLTMCGDVTYARLSKLIHLESLTVIGCELDLTVLLSLSQLTKLEIKHREPMNSAILPQLTQLRSLDVDRGSRIPMSMVDTMTFLTSRIYVTSQWWADGVRQ